MSNTPKLDALIEYCVNAEFIAGFKEIRDHIQRWSPKEPTRYPSELETCHDSEQEVDELREHINDLEILLTDARANLEIERHRKKQTNSDYDGITKEAQTFMFKQGRKDLGYPSEIETRLIELVEYCVRCVLGFQDAEHVKGVLAAIKRDLGLP